MAWVTDVCMERPPRQGEERGGRRGSPQVLTGGVSAKRIVARARAPGEWVEPKFRLTDDRDPRGRGLLAIANSSEKAIAAPASTGLGNPGAASGKSATL
ncbi:hypothetical protein GCM10009634_25950 [Saccharothrix xinjiangensis]